MTCDPEVDPPPAQSDHCRVCKHLLGLVMRDPSDASSCFECAVAEAHAKRSKGDA